MKSKKKISDKKKIGKNWNPQHICVENPKNPAWGRSPALSRPLLSDLFTSFYLSDLFQIFLIYALISIKLKEKKKKSNFLKVEPGAHLRWKYKKSRLGLFPDPARGHFWVICLPLFFFGYIFLLFILHYYHFRNVIAKKYIYIYFFLAKYPFRSERPESPLNRPIL